MLTAEITQNMDLTEELNDEFKTYTSAPHDAFPIGVFHPTIQSIIMSLHNTMNYPIEYTSASFLSASSTAIGNMFKVEVKKYAWYEKCNLYMVIVGLAGSIKSHPMDFGYKPISDVDKKEYNSYQEELKAFKEDKKKGVEGEKPIFCKTIMSDFTPEALSKAHISNEKGLSIVVDELKGWLKNFDRYSSGGEEQLYLTLWSGKSWIIDRATDGLTMNIPDPFVNVIGTIQPKLIKDFAQGDKSDNGFLDRMLFVNPKNESLNLWSNKEINKSVIVTYNNLITNLIELPHQFNFKPEDHKSGIIITFNEEARNYLYQWQNEEEKKLLNRDYNYEKSIFAKIQIYAIRFCLILHLQDLACENRTCKEIDIETVKRSILLAEYFRKESLEIRETIDNPNPLVGLTQKQRDVLFSLPKTFFKKDGENIVKNMKMSSATFSRFLKKKNLFKKVEHGTYLNLSK